MSVVGYVTFGVHVNCPHCNGRLDLNDYPYEDTDNELGMALFGGTTEPAKWNDLAIDYECCRCKKTFRLCSVEY